MKSRPCIESRKKRMGVFLNSITDGFIPSVVAEAWCCYVLDQKSVSTKESFELFKDENVCLKKLKKFLLDHTGACCVCGKEYASRTKVANALRFCGKKCKNRFYYYKNKDSGYWKRRRERIKRWSDEVERLGNIDSGLLEDLM